MPALNRREFLSLAAASAALSLAPAAFASPSPGRGKPPFRVLYNNDTTNILSCTSPWHKKGEVFRAEMLEATVDEVAGRVDVHLLAPGLCWAPWWKSKVLPIEEQCRWIKETYGLRPDTISRYVLEGGDIVQVFIDRCRKTGQAPFISFRMNDGHHKEQVVLAPGQKRNDAACQGLTREYVEHPEYRIGPNPSRWEQRVWNFAIPDVRERRLALMRELCETYDIAGFELDFLRFNSFFQQDKTTSEQRRSIMTGFMRDLRKTLDRSGAAGHRKWLCARIPSYIATHDALGIDVKAFVDAGVEMFNLSDNYFTEQQTDAAAIKKLAPDSAVYLEATHTTRPGPKVVLNTRGYDDFSFRRTTDEQFYTAAHLAYSQGLDGMSLFNFVYYREHGTPLRGPFNEPPFHVLKRLGDPAWLATQPQHYFVASVWNTPPYDGRPLGTVNRFVKIKPGETFHLNLTLAPPTGGWKQPGKLRIQSAAPLADAKFTAALNGQTLEATDDVSEPFPNPYPPLLATPETARAWTAPTTLLREGANQLTFTLSGKKPVTLVFVDLAIPVPSPGTPGEG